MLKTVEDISTTKKRLRIEIPADAVEKEIRDSLEKVKMNTKVPGFRPGKVPMNLIEKKFGKKVEEDVISKLIPKVYVDALNEANITPVSNPVMEEELDFKRNQPISMTLTVEIMPDIGSLNYEGIAVKEIPFSVEDSDIEDVLKRLEDERATYEPSEGPADMNDLIVFDYSTAESGEEAKDQVFKVGTNLFPDDFSKGLIGKNKGDEFVITTAFPEDHQAGKLAGKKLTLNVVLKDVKKINLPGIDDELAKDLGFESIDKLRKHIREEILRSKENEAAKIKKAEIIRQLIESHEFDVPESLLENEINMLASGMMSKNEHDKEKDVDPESLKQKLRPNAVRNVKASLLIETIGKKERVTVSDDEVKNMMLYLSRKFGVQPEDLLKFYMSKDGSLNGVKSTIFEDKVLDLILSKAVLVKGE